MDIDFKEIHIGKYIREQMEQKEISMERVCNFFKTGEKEVIRMYGNKSIDTDSLLKWCKLLEFDFFRLYVNHLLLYDGISQTKSNKKIRQSGEKIIFRKNIYTKEIKEFLVSLVTSNQKTVSQITEEYNIPRTTLYKWLRKH